MRPGLRALAGATGLAAALLLGGLGAAPATAQTEVPADWSLVPSGIGPGDTFRLLFASSNKRNAQPTAIATYNTFVQNRAAAGHSAIQSYSDGFRVVGCTAAVDARDNTSTTYTTSDKGVPIYWLDGNKVADDYEDFYDGSWDDETNAKNEAGNNRSLTPNTNYPWTGCDDDGTEAVSGTISRALGASGFVQLGRPNNNTDSNGPLQSNVTAIKSETHPLYGLSEVFQVASGSTLSGLAVMDEDGHEVDLSPAFSSATPDYRATVSYPVEAVTVEPEKADANATVEFLDGEGMTLADADGMKAGHQVALGVGANAIVMRVTAEDPSAVETYTVTVTREAPVSPLPPGDCRADAVWCTTLVAELNAGTGEYGYCPAGTTDCDFGSVDVDAFILDGAGYRVASVRVLNLQGRNYPVYLSLDRDLPPDRLAALTLRVGPHILDLKDAVKVVDSYHPSFVHNYEFAHQKRVLDFVNYAPSVANPKQVTVQLSVAPNIPAGGTPVIVGAAAAQAGKTLAADTSAVFDLNGLSGAKFEYQWVLVDGGTETDIAGATGSTYMPVADDVGKTLKVRVRFTDDNGYAEERASAATAAVAADIATDSDDHALVALTLKAADGSTVALAPGFASPTASYTASVANGVTQVTVQATTRDNDASVAYLDGADMDLADADGVAEGFQLTLAEGENTVKLKVTAENGASRTYMVTVTRAVSSFPGVVGCRSDAAWCATLTVGKSAGNASGYCSGLGNHCDYGSLSDDDFTLDPTDYIVKSVRWGTSGKSVHLTLDKDFPEDARDVLTLWIGTHNFDLAYASRGSSYDAVTDNNYRWKGQVPESLPNLEADTTLTVQLTRDDNTPPVFAGTPPLSRSVSEDAAPGTAFGAVVTASDADSDPLTYSLEGDGAASFTIDPATGQLWTALSLDHETAASHEFKVKADDGRYGGTATVNVTVTVTDVNEQPATPAAPTATATPGTATGLDVAWSEPGLGGGPGITGYEVQHRPSVGPVIWSLETLSGAGTSTTITGLTADTDYLVRVRALNGETESEWSDASTGRTGSAANTAAVGAPVIEGTAMEGATLSVDTSSITDADGLSSPGYAYRWERVVAGVGTGIEGADGSSYRVVAADVGAKMRVRVTFTDDGGNRETLASAATGRVSPFAMTACQVPDLTGRNEVWRATLTVGSDLDRHGYQPGFIGALSDSDFEYESEQFVVDQFAHYFNFAAIDLVFILTSEPSATATERLRLHICDEVFDLKDNAFFETGNGLTTIRWINSGIEWFPNTSLAVALSQPNTAPAVENEIPDQTGKDAAAAGTAFSYRFPADTFSDTDGDALSYTATQTDDSALPTWLTFTGPARLFSGTPGAADVGTLAVKVTAGDPNGGSVSDEFEIEVSEASPDATGKPEITGTPQVGQTLTATIGTIADDDDLPTTFPDDYRFQWVRVDAATSAETDVGSDSHTYEPDDDDVGHTIRVEVTFTDGVDTEETLASDAVGPVAAAAEDCATERSDAHWCTTLTVGESPGGSGTAYGFEHNVHGALAAPVTFNDGATTYEVRGLWIWDADSGTDGVIVDFQTGRVPHGTVFDLGGTTFTTGATSEHSDDTRYRWDRPSGFDWLVGQKVTVSARLPNAAATGAPEITGTAQVGGTLTAGAGNMDDGNGLPATTFPTGYSFQWVRVDGSDNSETDIGTDSQTYAPAADDVGHTIRVEVTFTDGGGAEETLASDAAGPVAAAAADCATARPHNDWCTTLTVAENDPSGGSGTAYGFSHNSYGSLGDGAIVHGDTWQVHGLWIWDADSGTDGVVVDFETGRVPHGTVFDFGGTAFTAGATSEHSDTTRYRWDRPSGFDWLVGQEVTVSANLPPVLSDATVNGDKLVLTYAEDLDTNSVPVAGDYEVKKTPDGGSEETVSLSGSPAIDGATVTLTLAAAVAADDDVTVSYTPGSSPVRDESSIAAPAIDPAKQEVTNDTAAGIAIAAAHAKLGAGLEDLVFTLTRPGETTSELDATVEIVQDQAWLADADLSHTVTFAVGDDTATLTIGHAKFSLDPEASGNLTATSSATGFAGGTATVEVVSIADPPVTIAYDMDSYSFAEDAAAEDVNIYVTATVDPAYPRPPSFSIGFIVTMHSGTASAPGDYGQISEQTAVASSDFKDESGSQVARYLLRDSDDNKFAIVSDEVYEGDEALAVGVDNRIRFNRTGLLRFRNADDTFCTANSCPDIRYPVTITDEGDLPSLTLAADPATIAEADDGDTPDVVENVSVLTVAIDNAKTFAADQTITLAFGGTAPASDYGVTPVDADTNTDDHQVTLAAEASSVEVTVTAVANATVDGAREIAVTASHGDTAFGTATVAIADDDAPSPDATGKPEITGTPQVGQTLTATIGTIADDDDLPTTTFPDGYSFQWVRVDGATSAETDISGETSQTYEPVADDVGHTIRVEVTFTDGGGTSETLASETAAVVAAAEDCAIARPHHNWCTTLTVEADDQGLAVYYGFEEGDSGALADKTLAHGATTYTVDRLRLNESTSTLQAELVVISFETGRVPHGTVFDFGGTTFTAGADSESTSGDTYQWSRPSDFAWLDGQKVTVSANLPPVLTGATVDGASLVLTYHENLDTNSVPAASAYSVSVDSGTAAAPSSVGIAADKVTLTLASSVTSGQAVTVSYTPGSSPVQDESGLDAEALDARAVTLTPSVRDAAQILIRNAAVVPDAAPGASALAGDAHVAALVRLVRAVARREVLPGYEILASAGGAAGGLTLIETWRGPRFAVLVFEAARPASPGSRSGASEDADGSAGLAGTIEGLPGAGRVAALWVAAPGTGPSGGRLGLAVIEAAPAGESR